MDSAHKYINLCSLKTSSMDNYKRVIVNYSFQATRFSTTSMQTIQISFKKLWLLLSKTSFAMLDKWKKNTQKWSHGDVLGKLSSRNKIFQILVNLCFKFINLCLKYDVKIVRLIAKYEDLKLIATKRQALYKKEYRKS